MIISGFAPPPDAGTTVKVEVKSNEKTLSFQLGCDGGPFEQRLSLYVQPGEQELRLRVDPLWSPAATGSTDSRRLGLLLKRVAFEVH